VKYVDHDPAASRHAAAVCRDMAVEHRQTAGRLELEPGMVAWWGPERDRVVAAVGVLAGDLRAEASSLEATADLLEAAARAAEQREADLAARARAEAAAASAAPCPPARGRPMVSAADDGRQRRARSHTSGGRS
jgi:hypothetical protein